MAGYIPFYYGKILDTYYGFPSNISLGIIHFMTSAYQGIIQTRVLLQTISVIIQFVESVEPGKIRGRELYKAQEYFNTAVCETDQVCTAAQLLE